MKTIEKALQECRGFGQGFDFLRVFLAISVLWFHSFVVTGNMSAVIGGKSWFFAYSIMPMFFALSGFLIAASAERLSIENFLINRGLRIVPALAVEIVISALIIGPVFTEFSLREYLSGREFWSYFTNVIGWIRYELPGVFLAHPSAGVVNQSLWTVPFEVGCYVLISGVIVLRLARRPTVILGIATALLLVPVLAQAAGLLDSRGKTGLAILDYAFFSRGSLLFPSFLIGTLFYYYRKLIPFSGRLALLCLGLCLSIAWLGQDGWRSWYALNLVSVPPLVYLTVHLGLTAIPSLPVYSRGDYSYGIYLYGYPLQQCLVALLPGSGWALNFLLSLLSVSAAAAFSWHLIERPILKLRRNFSFVARQRLEHDRAAGAPVRGDAPGVPASG